MKLTYPRELIDLGFIVPKGLEGDQVLEKLKSRLREVQGRGGIAGGKFNHVTIMRQDVEVPIVSQDEKGLFPTFFVIWRQGLRGRAPCVGTSKSTAVDVIGRKKFTCINDVGTTYRMGSMAGCRHCRNTAFHNPRPDAA